MKDIRLVGVPSRPTDFNFERLPHAVCPICDKCTSGFCSGKNKRGFGWRGCDCVEFGYKMRNPYVG